MKNKYTELFTNLFSRKTNSNSLQLLRYIFVGGIAFVFDFLFLFFFTEFTKLGYLISAGLSFLIGLVVNYALSISWIFNKEKFTWDSLVGHDFVIFIITGLIGLGLNGILMFTLTDLIVLNYLVSKLITVPIVLFWNFLSRKYLL